jgi:integrase
MGRCATSSCSYARSSSGPLRSGTWHATPARGVGRFPRADEETPDPFTPSELRAVLAAATKHDPVFATLVTLSARTGMRAGEVTGLRVGDLDVERAMVVVERTFSRGRIGPTKTRRARVVSLTHPTIEDTLDWRPGSTWEARRPLGLASTPG